jgi:ureidoglycolate hydrolase
MKDQSIAGLEAAGHDGPGYQPLLESDGDWMAAIMNGTPTSWSVPEVIEKHPGTDELFVLVTGRAIMVMAGGGEKPGEIQQVEMEPNVLYNVKRGYWHATLMSADAKIIIVERTGTNIDGSVLVPLSESQRAAIKLD